MIQKVAAVDGIVQVLPLAIAQLPGLIVATIDPALSTNAVRAFDRRQADQVDLDAQFGKLHGGRETGQSAADDYYAMLVPSVSYR